MKNKQSTNKNKFEEALNDVYRADIAMDITFKKNLDKLVDNTIKAQKLQQKAELFKKQNHRQKKGIFALLFRGFKFQGAFLASFLVFLIFGGIAFASVPGLREIIKPSSGLLSVESQPPQAKVFLEGGDYDEQILLGHTPIEQKLKAGEYTMVIRLEGYEDYTTHFSLEIGKSALFDITLKKKDQILDRIKEWKTYNDANSGIEFTYPLSWDFKKQDYTSTNKKNSVLYSEFFLSGKNSEILIYKHTSPIDELEKKEFSIEGKTYQGLQNYKEWKYVVMDSKTSAKQTNTYKVAFFTSKTKEFEIYDFILDSIKVYDIGSEVTQADWTLFKQPNIGFSLKYPKDWIIIEKEHSEFYSEYNVKPFDNETEPLRVIYSQGYFEDLSSYVNQKENVVTNGIDAEHYMDENNTSNLLVLPNRLFIIYPETDNEETRTTFAEIVETITITKENSWQTLSDYNWGYEIHIPGDWKYTVTVCEDFERTCALFTDGQNKIFLYRWEDVADTWDSYRETLSQLEATNRTQDVRIDDTIFSRYEAWRFENNAYYLYRILYLKDSLENEPYITLDERKFVVIIENTIEPVLNPENLPKPSEEKLLLFDAIVSSLVAVGQ